jgi:hypothetical protein
MISQVPAMAEELMTALGGRDAPLRSDPVQISANLAHGLVALLAQLEVPSRSKHPVADTTIAYRCLLHADRLERDDQPLVALPASLLREAAHRLAPEVSLENYRNRA